MRNPVLKTSERESELIILIVDKIGVIGERLSQELSNDYIIFFVSSKPPKNFNKKIIHIPFKGSIPKVPENAYFKTFIIDDGNSVTKESSFSFIKKAKTTNSLIYFLGSIRNIDLGHSDEIVKYYKRARVLLFGDLFDDEIIFDKNISVTKYLLEIKRKKEIKVRGEGLALNYPISFEDTIKLIIKATHIEIPQKVLLLFSKHPITDISLANTFQKIDPDIKVDFIKEEKVSQIHFPKNSQYALASYDLKTKLSELNLEKVSSGSFEMQKNKTLELRHLKPILFFLIACFFLLLLPFITTSAYTFLGFNQIQNAKNLAEEGNFEKALEKAENAETFFNFALKTNGPFAYQMKLIGQEKESNKIQEKILVGIDLSHASVNLLDGAIELKKISSGSGSGQRGSLEKAISSFKSANVTLQELRASNQIPKDMSENIGKIMPLVSLFSNTSDVAEDVLGFQNEKRYLMLFQDNLELRPGGGVVEVAGIVRIRNGKVNEFKIINVEKLDSSLGVHLESPFYLRRYLPIEEYNLRNSAMSADFVTSAINASSIYNLESGEDVDGVIGVNLIFVKNILNAIGPVTVSGKQINSENLFEELLRDENFYENVIVEIRNKFKNSRAPYFSIAQEIGDSIEEKNLLFAFKDQGMQNLFNANNLSSSLVDGRKNEKGVNDYFGISEANLGESGLNYYISRSIIRNLKIDEDGQMSAEVKIAFKNSNQKSNSSQNVYRNYLQVILPKGSRIIDVSVGGESRDLIPATIDPQIYERNGFVPPLGLEIGQTEEKNKSIFGFFVTIPPESAKTITVEYSLPFNISSAKFPIMYSLYVYKQPGIESYPFEQTLDVSEPYSIFPDDPLTIEIRKDMIYNFKISSK